MRIGADGSWLQWPRSGVGKHLDTLLHGLSRVRGEGDELIVYYNSFEGTGRHLFAPPVRERFIRLPNRTLWNQLRVAQAVAADRCDVYLAGAIVAPVLLGTRCVPVVLDCLAFRDPAAKPGAEGRYWRRWTRAAARRARRVIAISESTAEDCVRFLGIPRSTIQVIHPVVDARFSPADPEEHARARDRLLSLGVSERFILQVGAFELHKGGRAAVDAVAALRADRPDLRLVRCGPPGPVTARAGEAVTLGYVDDGTLLDLYRCAAALLVASTYEGFGMPVVEALACGTPVVATSSGALREAGGRAVTYASGTDGDALAAALRTVLDEADDARARRRAAGLDHAAGFQWEPAARATLEVLREVAQGTGVSA